MKKIIIVLLSLFLVSGCRIKDAEETVNQSSQDPNIVNNTLKQIYYQGMYNFSDNTGKFTVCGSGRNYLLSSLGANKTLDSAYKTFSISRSKRKLYLTAEGFTSVDQRKNNKEFDTVLVITRIISSDSTFSCE
ncbi:MAG TPA: hypothetical protein PKC91_12200 [Ignavibacteria bacterium]|nr:hypothetical protein [Ignavibacteria bacterium]